MGGDRRHRSRERRSGRGARGRAEGRGEAVDPQIVVEPSLITQEFLRDNGIKTIEQLARSCPSSTRRTLVTAPWFEALGR